jgi:uncharacterized membrane protein YgcG
MRCLKVSSRIFGVMALLAVMLGVQGCFDSTLPNAPPSYPGPEEYANYGYTNDPLIYAAYDPFLYGFWCPPPYYFYWYNPVYYRPGCYGGYCGPHGRKPLRPVYPWPLVASHAPTDKEPNPAKATIVLEPSDTRVPPQPTVSLNDDNPSESSSHGEASMTHETPARGFSGGGFGGFGGGGGHGSFHH